MKRLSIEKRAELTTACEPAAAFLGSEVGAGRGVVRHRRISHEAGRALEILGHAIEYLADEFAHGGEALVARGGQVEAMQLLMKMNRQIYFACPEVPTMSDRLRALVGLGVA
jgi:hypothetical protein